jgi:hypothetical protein
MTSHQESPVADRDSAEIVKRSFRAYVDKDRSAIERLIAEDFTSPVLSTIASIERPISSAAGRTADGSPASTSSPSSQATIAYM